MDGTPAQGYMRVITYSGLPGAVFGILRAGADLHWILYFSSVDHVTVHLRL